jgi:hypothetical protein
MITWSLMDLRYDQTIMLHLLIMVLLQGFVISQTNNLAGVPSDKSFCSLSDGTFLYQGTNTDPAKIIKYRMEDMTRVAEYIVPFSRNIGYLCPATFDTKFQNMYFIGHIGGQRGPLAIIKTNTSLSDVTIAELTLPNSVFFVRDIFMDSTYIYITYPNNDIHASEMIRVNISTLQSDGSVLRLSSDVRSNFNQFTLCSPFQVLLPILQVQIPMIKWRYLSFQRCSESN